MLNSLSGPQHSKQTRWKEAGRLQPYSWCRLALSVLLKRQPCPFKAPRLFVLFMLASCFETRKQIARGLMATITNKQQHGVGRTDWITGRCARVLKTQYWAALLQAVGNTLSCLGYGSWIYWLCFPRWREGLFAQIFLICQGIYFFIALFSPFYPFASLCRKF